MDFKKLLKKGDNTGDLSVLERKKQYRKNVFRTDDQRMAAFYFSDENVKPNDLSGCFKKKTKAKGKGCFSKEEEDTVKRRPYFDDDEVKGCFSFKKKETKHYMSDADYDSLVKKIVEGSNFKAQALEALCVDESEVQEIDPIHFGGRLFDDNTRRKLGEDWYFRTTGWQETWLFFSATSLMAYQIDLATDSNNKIERTWEYQYKDITSIKILENTKEEIDDDGQRFYKESKFEITVANDSLLCSFNNNNEQVNSIKAMKAMIRDKKNN